MNGRCGFPLHVALLAMLACLVARAAAGLADEPAAEWHVAPSGDDAHPGTKERPFATLERARAAARQHDRAAADAAPATIWLAPGIYERLETLALDARDSKLVIRGPADRSARLHAGRVVGRDLLQPPPARVRERVARWSVAEGVWLEGYWRVPWDPATIRVSAIDPATRRVDLAAAVQGGIGSKYAPKGELGDGKEPWWAVNLPEEIDLPGEWCIDGGSKTLVFWRPEGFSPQSEVRIATMTEPLVRIEEATMVALRDLVLEGGLGDGIVISGGHKALVLGCLVRNFGGNGLTVIGGTRHTVRGCDMHSLGASGIILAGGDRKTLAACGHAALNNDIQHVGRRRKTWAAAIHVGGTSKENRRLEAVGCRVAHNFLHDLPHAAVLYTGNDHVLELNEVCRVALTSSDVGAFYTSHDWTSHGNVLRRNFVYDCPRANAFYVDDGDSGDIIEENVIVRAACGPFIGGGHDNVVRHNLIVECEIGIHIDSRGVSRGYATATNLRKRLADTPLTDEPWWTKYPAIAKLLDPNHDAGIPHGNVIVGNVTVRCRTPSRTSGKPAELAHVQAGGNLDLAAGTGDNDPRFADPGVLDYALGSGSPVFRRIKDFAEIPFNKIGLEKDAYRSAIPVRERIGGAEIGGSKAAATISSQLDLDTTNEQAGGHKERSGR